MYLQLSLAEIFVWNWCPWLLLTYSYVLQLLLLQHILNIVLITRWGRSREIAVDDKPWSICVSFKIQRKKRQTRESFNVQVLIYIVSSSVYLSALQWDSLPIDSLLSLHHLFKKSHLSLNKKQKEKSSSKKYCFTTLFFLLIQYRHFHI